MSLADELLADLEDDEEDLELPEVKDEDMETEDIKPNVKLLLLLLHRPAQVDLIPVAHSLADVSVLHNSDKLR